MLSSFAKTNFIETELLPFSLDSILPNAWYPYEYLISLNRLIEERIPDSKSILFWAGVKFIELWYWEGPGKEMISSGLDWVYCNDKGGGYNSVVRGENVGWCKNLVTNEQQGFALIENVMPISAAYLRGIFFGGFYLFDDMAYFNAEIESSTINPDFPFLRTIVRLTFKQAQVGIDKAKLESFSKVSVQEEKLTPQEAEEILWRFRHQLNISKLSLEYTENISDLANLAFKRLYATKEALAKANRQLAADAITDPLTGLNNKRYFNCEIPKRLNMAKRYHHSVCAMMIDIDYFKRYNDRYGHLSGDLAIKAVAECINESLSRGSDFVARFGGEEFVCIIINLDETGIRTIARKIVTAVESKQILHEKSAVSAFLTISIGSALQQECADSIDELLKQADDALYDAKRQGRNRHVHIDCRPA